MSAMGQWMRHQGYTWEQVAMYEAYLASRREYVCLWPGLRPRLRA
jgi:hypothetical protein